MTKLKNLNLFRLLCVFGALLILVVIAILLVQNHRLNAQLAMYQNEEVVADEPDMGPPDLSGAASPVPVATPLGTGSVATPQPPVAAAVAKPVPATPTTFVYRVTHEDDERARGLLHICGVKRANQDTFLTAVLVDNAGKDQVHTGRIITKRDQLNVISEGDTWTFRYALCPRLANHTDLSK